MNLGKFCICFAIGFVFGGMLTTIADQLYEGDWRGGPAIVWLALPVTAAYFVLLCVIILWRHIPVTVGGALTTGVLCGGFPVVFGLFPIYYYRLLVAIPIAIAQFALLVGTLVAFAKLRH